MSEVNSCTMTHPAYPVGKANRDADAPKVSIIIPIYNDELYLRQALDSAAAQTLREIEIICVNDGSTDGTSEILSEYAARDGRFIAIHHENNKGTLVARKSGVKAARGEYCLFLDADDYLAPECCETALNLIRQKQVDMLWFSSDTLDYNEDGSCIRTKQIPNPLTVGKVIAKPLSLPLEYDGGNKLTLWGIIYHTQLVRRSLEAMGDFYCVYGEDLYMSFFISYYAQSLTGCDTRPLMIYCRGRGISGDSMTDLDTYRLICAMSELSRRMRVFLEREGSWERNRSFWQNYSQRMACDCCLELRRIRHEDYPAAKEILMEAWGNVSLWDEIAWRLSIYAGSLSQWSLELQQAKTWLEKQVAAKDARIAELENCTAEQDKAKTWLEKQVAAKDAHVAELEDWAKEQDKAKTWIEEQVAARDAHIAELESWAKEQDKAKIWLEEQVAARGARIAELESWTSEQDKVKEWFLGQIDQKDQYIIELEEENAALRQWAEKPWYERLFSGDINNYRKDTGEIENNGI